MTVGGEDGTDEVVYCLRASACSMPAVPPNCWIWLRSSPRTVARSCIHQKMAMGFLLCSVFDASGGYAGRQHLPPVPEWRIFSENTLSILQTLANQAAIAIENARLFEESRRLQAETRKLYELALRQRTRRRGEPWS